MKLALGVAVAVVLTAGAMADAAPRGDGVRADAPRLLKEGLKAGDTDLAAFAAIADWILHEKEEKVAAGLLDVLSAVEPRIAGRDGQRWNAAAQAMVALFQNTLRDARMDRRRTDADTEADIAALVSAAAPAIAATLTETAPKVWAPLLDALQGADRCETPPGR